MLFGLHVCGLHDCVVCVVGLSYLGNRNENNQDETKQFNRKRNKTQRIIIITHE